MQSRISWDYFVCRDDLERSAHKDAGSRPLLIDLAAAAAPAEETNHQTKHPKPARGPVRRRTYCLPGHCFIALTTHVRLCLPGRSLPVLRAQNIWARPPHCATHIVTTTAATLLLLSACPPLSAFEPRLAPLPVTVAAALQPASPLSASWSRGGPCEACEAAASTQPASAVSQCKPSLPAGALGPRSRLGGAGQWAATLPTRTRPAARQTGVAAGTHVQQGCRSGGGAVRGELGLLQSCSRGCALYICTADGLP